MTWPAVIDFTGLGSVKERFISVRKTLRNTSLLCEQKTVCNTEEHELKRTRKRKFNSFTAALQPDFNHAPQIQLVRSHLIDLKENVRSDFPASSKTAHIDFKGKKE